MKTYEILVVDDEKTIRAALRRLFNAKGFIVHTAQDGADAINILRDSRPDIILLDLGMPRSDGLDVLEEVSLMASPPPVLVLTAYADTERAQKARSLGARKIMAKPFELDEIEREVDAAMEDVRER